MQTIIQQIDSLSNIASEFSDFAKMPKANAEVIDLNQAVRDAAQLFADVPFNLGLDLPGDGGQGKHRPRATWPRIEQPPEKRKARRC